MAGSGVDDDLHAAHIACNASKVCAGLGAHASDANRTVVAAHAQVADVDVVAAGDNQPSFVTEGNVIDPGGVVEQRLPAAGRVEAPGPVGIQRPPADGRIVVPGSICR